MLDKCEKCIEALHVEECDTCGHEFCIDCYKKHECEDYAVPGWENFEGHPYE